MTANAIMHASYSDLKLIKSRSVCQIVLEIPIERAAAAVEMFGVPIPGQEIAVAVARLQESTGRIPGAGAVRTIHSDGPGATPARPVDTAKSARAKAAFAALPSMKQDVTRAAMLVKDPEFQRWITGRAVSIARPASAYETEADYEMKIRIGVASKSEIGEDAAVNARFRKLVATFELETGRMAECRA